VGLDLQWLAGFFIARAMKKNGEAVHATGPAERCRAAISDDMASWPEIRRNPFSASSNAYESHRLAWSVSIRKRVTRPSLRRVFKNEFSIALVLSSER
jgi:hypothetical protein